MVHAWDRVAIVPSGAFVDSGFGGTLVWKRVAASAPPRSRVNNVTVERAASRQKLAHWPHALQIEVRRVLTPGPSEEEIWAKAEESVVNTTISNPSRGHFPGLKRDVGDEDGVNGRSEFLPWDWYWYFADAILLGWVKSGYYVPGAAYRERPLPKIPYRSWKAMGRRPVTRRYEEDREEPRSQRRRNPRIHLAALGAPELSTVMDITEPDSSHLLTAPPSPAPRSGTYALIYTDEETSSLLSQDQLLAVGALPTELTEPVSPLPKRPGAPTPSRWNRPATSNFFPTKSPRPVTPCSNITDSQMKSLMDSAPRSPVNASCVTTPSISDIDFTFGAPESVNTFKAEAQPADDTQEDERSRNVNKGRRRKSEPLINMHLKRGINRRISASPVKLASLPEWETMMQSSPFHAVSHTGVAISINDNFPATPVPARHHQIQTDLNLTTPAVPSWMRNRKPISARPTPDPNAVYEIDVRQNPDIFAVGTSAESSHSQAVQELAGIVEHRCAGHANITVSQERGKLVLRVKLPSKYAYLFPDSQGDDESHFTSSPAAATYSPCVTSKGQTHSAPDIQTANTSQHQDTYVDITPHNENDDSRSTLGMVVTLNSSELVHSQNSNSLDADTFMTNNWDQTANVNPSVNKISDDSRSTLGMVFNLNSTETVHSQDSPTLDVSTSFIGNNWDDTSIVTNTPSKVRQRPATSKFIPPQDESLEDRTLAMPWNDSDPALNSSPGTSSTTLPTPAHQQNAERISPSSSLISEPSLEPSFQTPPQDPFGLTTAPTRIQSSLNTPKFTSPLRQSFSCATSKVLPALRQTSNVTPKFQSPLKQNFSMNRTPFDDDADHTFASDWSDVMTPSQRQPTQPTPAINTLTENTSFGSMLEPVTPNQPLSAYGQAAASSPLISEPAFTPSFATTSFGQFDRDLTGLQFTDFTPTQPDNGYSSFTPTRRFNGKPSLTPTQRAFNGTSPTVISSNRTSTRKPLISQAQLELVPESERDQSATITSATPLDKVLAPAVSSTQAKSSPVVNNSLEKSLATAFNSPPSKLLAVATGSAVADNTLAESPAPVILCTDSDNAPANPASLIASPPIVDNSHPVLDNSHPILDNLHHILDKSHPILDNSPTRVSSSTVADTSPPIFHAVTVTSPTFAGGSVINEPTTNAKGKTFKEIEDDDIEYVRNLVNTHRSKRPMVNESGSPVTPVRLPLAAKCVNTASESPKKDKRKFVTGPKEEGSPIKKGDEPAAKRTRRTEKPSERKMESQKTKQPEVTAPTTVEEATIVEHAVAAEASTEEQGPVRRSSRLRTPAAVPTSIKLNKPVPAPVLNAAVRKAQTTLATETNKNTKNNTGKTYPKEVLAALSEGSAIDESDIAPQPEPKNDKALGWKDPVVEATPEKVRAAAKARAEALASISDNSEEDEDEITPKAKITPAPKAKASLGKTGVTTSKPAAKAKATPKAKTHPASKANPPPKATPAPKPKATLGKIGVAKSKPAPKSRIATPVKRQTRSSNRRQE